MSPSEAQTFGMGENVKELLVKEQPVLKKGGMDVDAAIMTLDSILRAAIDANALQHDLRRQAQAATVQSVEMTHRLYITASGFLDMAIAAVSKDSPAAKEFRVLRSRIDRPPREGEPGGPTPQPTAP